MVNITISVNSRERSGINTILHELNPLFTINVTMRDIKSKNVYSRVNSKASTQWINIYFDNGVHLEIFTLDLQNIFNFFFKEHAPHQHSHIAHVSRLPL